MRIQRNTYGRMIGALCIAALLSACGTGAATPATPNAQPAVTVTAGTTAATGTVAPQATSAVVPTAASPAATATADTSAATGTVAPQATSVVVPTAANPAVTATASSVDATGTVAPQATSVTVPTLAPGGTAAATPGAPAATSGTAAATPAAENATAAPAAAAATAPPAALEPIDPAVAAELQRVLDETVASGVIPGAVASVQLPGRALWVGTAGIQDRQSGALIEASTRMRIASISKIFTAVVALQLAEEGKLNLDAPVATWFPEIVPQADRITVRMLLNHTSGLYDYLEDLKFLNQAYAGGAEREWAPAELVAYAAQQRPSFAPGAEGRWDYSSTNFVLAGMIIEQVTGRKLAQEVRERIFVPVGMQSSYYPTQEPVEGTMARGYSQGREQTNISMSFVFATANIVATTEDVNRFGQALFGGKLLKPDSMAQLMTWVNGQGQYNMPALEYGLGVMRNQLPVNRSPEVSTVMGHIGGFGGFRSALWHAPESNITIELGVNQAATDPNLLSTRLFDVALRATGR